MKKTYIIPESMVIGLTPVHHILTGSADLHEDGNGNLVGGLQDGNASDYGLTKESTSLWDEEW